MQIQQWVWVLIWYWWGNLCGIFWYVCIFILFLINAVKFKPTRFLQQTFHSTITAVCLHCIYTVGSTYNAVGVKLILNVVLCRPCRQWAVCSLWISDICASLPSWCDDAHLVPSALSNKWKLCWDNTWQVHKGHSVLLLSTCSVAAALCRFMFADHSSTFVTLSSPQKKKKKIAVIFFQTLIISRGWISLTVLYFRCWIIIKSYLV